MPDERDRAPRRRTSTPPPYETLPGDDHGFRAARRRQPRRSPTGPQRNVFPHKVPGYAIVTLSLKKTGVPPGDVTADQMDAVADLADRYSFGELRVSHEQNLVLADVRAGRPARPVAAR